MTELGAVYLSLANDKDSLIYNSVGFPLDHIEVIFTPKNISLISCSQNFNLTLN